ncbi:hypothetical protein WR25_19380 [Diploscapter pachys]|uniref:Uncharacterized protein n=1 Tax=Diploscapter pachys TaxID=2018661 RepID=A0A2A2KEI2_9BILA|nr:hypothetical protein WR25_19380 [Diploscapter pachys]
MNGQICTYDDYDVYNCTPIDHITWKNIYDFLKVDGNHYYLTSTWIIPAAKLILMGLFWLSTCCTGSDFTRTFLTSVAIPITVGAVGDAGEIIVPMLGLGTLSRYGLQHISAFADAIGTYTFATGSIFFILFTIATAARKKQVPCAVAFICFYLTLGVMSGFMLFGIIGPMFLGTSEAYYIEESLHQICMIVVLFSAGAHGILAPLVLISICFCSNREHNSTDPVVIHSQCRLAWLIPYCILVPLTVLPDYIGDITDPYMSMTLALVTPPLIFIGCFLILPAYRSTIFCCCANLRYSYYSNNQVAPVVELPPNVVATSAEVISEVPSLGSHRLPPIPNGAIKYMVNGYGYPAVPSVPLPITHSAMAPLPAGYQHYYHPHATLPYGFHAMA